MPKNRLQQAGWLIGTWENSSEIGDFTEIWTKANDSVYKAESYVVKRNDTLFSEFIKLEEVHGKLAYIVSVPGQNNEKPVRFEMTSGTDKEMVFENPEHDFPNKITYIKITDDSIVAIISGMQKGKPTKEEFPMKRKK